mgnify:CR=1 FL=1
MTQLESIIEKKSIINIVCQFCSTVYPFAYALPQLQAFPVSVKHFLRGEQGVYYEDLYPLVCYLPQYANGEANGMERLPLWHAREHTYDEEEEEDSTIDEKQHRHTRGEPTLVNESKDGSRSSSRAAKKRKGNFDPEAALPEVESDIPLKPARNPPKTTLYDFIPLLRFFRWVGRVILRRARPGEYRRKKTVNIESNIPLEISLFLAK